MPKKIDPAVKGRCVRQVLEHLQEYPSLIAAAEAVARREGLGAGESWVGDGYRIASDGKTLVSRDGLRVFRPPSWKPNLSKYQANFEYWVEGQVTRKPIGNGHFDVTDMVP